ncbi:MAG: nitroreductase family protein [Anaerolineales bacterium]|jgi:nitroreductase
MNSRLSDNLPPKNPPFSKPIIDLISQRFSCRTYQKRDLDREIRSKLGDFAASTKTGPLGYEARFELVASSEQDPMRLRSLGTYGFISGASAYLVGAMEGNRFSPEDFGYLLEKLILYATDLGLGTCWLGGTFTKSSFAKKINARSSELVPAVSAVGYIAERPRRIETWLKSRRGTKTRKPWSQLFFDHRFNHPLPAQGLDGYHLALEMVRLAPSASNRQPWRVVRDENQYHFYLQRTPGYRDNLLTRWTTVADLQRMDMGIAMCHFELSAAEKGLLGGWQLRDPQIELLDEYTEYTVSWIA